MRTALLAIVLFACVKPAEQQQSAPPPAVETAPVTTDRARYELRPGPYGPQTTIVTTFTAPADKPVYLLNCNGALSVGMQRREGNTWARGWIAEINACHSQPILVPAGKTHTATMTPVDRSHMPVPPGTYRAIWYGVLTSYDSDEHRAGDELPLEQRVSAPFTIESWIR